MTLQEQFNERYGRNVVNGFFKTLTINQRTQLVIVGIAMTISYVHQLLYLLHLGAGIFAPVIPLSIDALMVSCIVTSQTVGIAKWDRRKARIVLVIPASVSGYVNFIAPGHIIVRSLFVWVVLAIILAEYVRNVRADFAEVEKNVEAHTVPVPVTDEHPLKGRKLTDEEKARRAAAREANYYAKLSRGGKRAYTREKNRKRELENAELDDMVDGYVPDNAPVSPATVR